MADKKKMESNFFNMVVVLTSVAFISALALGFTYTKTKDAIAAVELKKTIDGIKQVLPEFDNNPYEAKYSVDGFEGLEFYPAKLGDDYVGTAVKTFADGFTEAVVIMVGFDKDGKIVNTSVIQHKETPGLGSKMSTPKFRDQFNGKTPDGENGLTVKKDRGQIDAISAATISSRAFCEAVNKGYRGLIKGGKK
jgi:electron transport complex protein RnfG